MESQFVKIALIDKLLASILQFIYSFMSSSSQLMELEMEVVRRALSLKT
jgi:hypothetical protein